MTSRQYNQILRAKTSLKEDASFRLGLYRTLEVQGGDRSEGVSSSESEMDDMPQDTDEGVINCEATTTTAKNSQKDLLTRPSREERRGSSGGTEKRMTRKLRAFFTIGSKEEDLGDSSLVYSTHNRPHSRGGDPRLYAEKQAVAYQTHQKRSTRSFQHFLQDQERYRQLQLQRQIQLMEIKHQKTAQQMLPAPKVNLKSKQLVEKKLKNSCNLTKSSGVASKENSQPNVNVHQRLYLERSQEKQRGIQITEPCSDLKRSASKRTLKGHEIDALSSRLHTEAKDRQQFKEHLVNSVKKDQRLRVMATKPPTSRKCHATMKYAQGRFLREFEVALCEVFQGFRDELSYDEFIQISLFLGFARTMVADQQAINQLWILASKGHSTANIQAVVELYLQVDRILPSPYPAFISDFATLFANRQVRKPIPIAVEKSSFKPQLTKSTEKLAQQRRQRIINTSGSSTDLLSSVCLHKTGDMLAHLLQIPSSRNEALQNSEDRELVNCTFRPQILSKTKSKGGDRCLDLFQQSHHRLRSSEKQDKSTIDYEFDKQSSECTFKPTLLAKPTTTKHVDSKSNCSGMFGVATTLSDDFSKLPSFGNVSFTKRGVEPPKARPSSSRQQQPRQSSEHLKAPKHRLALPLNQPPQFFQEEEDDEIVNITSKTPFTSGFDALLRPILYIDVNLAPGRPSERLAVFQGDTPAGLADRFSQRHELEWGMRQRLERMLEARMLEVRCQQ